MDITEKELAQLDRIKRLNIINSITGVKPGNLVGTRSSSGLNNLAIMSSAVHLGSDPALIGLIFRPQQDNPRDTYLNILETKYYTLNHIPPHLIENAHYTSAKFEAQVDEFERCQIGEEFIQDFHAPFVKDSPIKVGLEFVEEIPIKHNNTILLIGSVKQITIDPHSINEEGQVNLETTKSVGISGLDHYYLLKKLDDFPYAHVNSVPTFKK